MKTYLYIDSTQKTNVLTLIRDKQIVDRVSVQTQDNLDNQFLLEIDKFLKKNDLNVQEVAGLIVNTGPGTFTGTRTGVTFANALKLANDNLEIYEISGLDQSDEEIVDSLNSKPKNTILSPKYSQEPSITRSKKLN